MKISDHKKKYLEYINSDEWAVIRVDMIEIYGSICQNCGNKTKAPQIHHLNYDNLFCENPEDLTLLCPKCHMSEHNLIKPKKYQKNRKITVSYASKIISKKFNFKRRKSGSWLSLANTLSGYLGKKNQPNKVLAKKFVKDYIKSLNV